MTEPERTEPERPIDVASGRAKLRRKYQEIARLRGHESLDPVAIRRAMRALASDFPGALRELDELPLETIHARLGKLDAAHDEEPETPWMRAQLGFHALARGALIAKRWCRAHAKEGRDHFTKWTNDPDALAWSDQLSAVARPPSGRLLALVYPALAARLGVTEEEARDLVFGDSLRRRRAARRTGA